MNAVDVLKYGHQTVLKTIEGLPQEAWETPGVCGVWSVKEIIAHLASYEQVLVDVLNSLQNEEPTPTLDAFYTSYETFNDAEVAKRRHKSAKEIWAEYEEAYHQAVTLMSQIPVEGRRLNGTLSWYGPDYNLEDFIVYTFYGHKREHSAQIAVFQDQRSLAKQRAL